LRVSLSRQSIIQASKIEVLIILSVYHTSGVTGGSPPGSVQVCLSVGRSV
jgi:hypothetical protein